MADELVRLAARKKAWWCQGCRQAGMIHCSDPLNCGDMRQIPFEEAAIKYAALRARSAQGEHGND